MHISYTIYSYKHEQELLKVGSDAEVFWYQLAESPALLARLESRGEKVKDMGFFVWVIPRFKRKPQKLFICSAYGAKNGSLPYEITLEHVKKFFNDKGIDVQYQGGFAYDK